MSPGTLVHLTETANLSAGIDPDVDLFGMILESVDYRAIVDTRPDENIRGAEMTSCYRVLLEIIDEENESC